MIWALRFLWAFMFASLVLFVHGWTDGERIAFAVNAVYAFIGWLIAREFFGTFKDSK